MGMPTSARRWVVRGSAVTVFLLAAGTGAQALAATQAGPPRMATSGGPVTDPYSPAYHHSYRHGVVPTTGRARQMRTWASQHAAAIHALSANDLNYGGGIDGIGVTTGHEKVYLVFYGSQWGTQGKNSSGDVTLSGDPSGIAPDLQQFLKGLGTGGELWSGVMTQYCDGVATGAQSCPASNTQHVAYPSGAALGGALAGVWVDEGTASPAAATPAQLGDEAVAAAAHFSNTTAASNRDAQYVIVSPHGTDPDGYKENGFCAWHDYNGDVGVTSTYGDIAFTNLPYLTDVGASCGANFVNSGSAGALDGASIVEGHEYAETITDQNPAGGWTDNFGSENGDKCAWVTPGTTGGAFNLKTSTGSFAVQTTWANDGNKGAGSCEGRHAVVINGGDTITVTNPGSQSTKKGTKVSLQIHATDNSLGQKLTYSASGLPKGLSIKSSTGLISGTPTTLGTRTVTVKVTDTTGASRSVTFSWKIHT
jgi:Putative Ig domain